MKRITIITVLAIITLTGLFAMGNSRNSAPVTQRDNDEIEKLWKDYDATVRSDSPMKGLKVLEQIKALAESKRSAWDFYKAGRQYCETASQRNWKQRDSLLRKFQEEIKLYNEPILTFFDSRNNLTGKASFIKTNKSALLAGHNDDFYTEGQPGSRVFSPLLTNAFSNDYEYVLWYIYLGWTNSSNPDWEECSQMLKEQIGDKYPLAQCIEFNDCLYNGKSDEREKNLQAFAGKYDGKAVALFARQELLSREFSSLGNKPNASSDEYKALKQKCIDFEKVRKGFKGEEKKIADCCEAVENIIDDLDSKSINANVSDGIVKISTRNIEKVEIEIAEMDKSGKRGKSVHKATVKNSVQSYYVYDTLTYKIPAINDGLYTLRCSNGDIMNESQYSKFTISISRKEDKDGHRVYAADAVSGRPLKNATLRLLGNNEEVLAEAGGVNFSDGYIALPEPIKAAAKKDKSMSLMCTYTDASGIVHNSEDISLYHRETRSQNSSKVSYAQLITDRSAFNPEETVQFKGVIFEGDRRKSLNTVPEGEKVTVSLRDVDGKIVEEKALTTNEFGSVAGSFVLARGEKNGIFQIELKYKGTTLARQGVRVDDFVLPTFELTFDPDTRFYLRGDEICVNGSIKSYSGHSLTGADVDYEVLEYGDVIKEGKVSVADDGKFSIRFDSDKDSDCHYAISIKVTDNTGETLSWSTSRSTFDSIPLRVTVLNKAEGQVRTGEKGGSRFYGQNEQCIVSDDQLDVNFDVKNYNSSASLDRENLKISYSLKHNGKAVISGNARPGENKSLDLKGLASGLYVLETKSVCPLAGDDDLESENSIQIMLVREGDTVVDADIENVFKVIDGDKIGVMFGSTAGETWANVDVYGVGNTLLAHKFIDLRGVRGQKGSLETILFDFKEDWSDVVEIQVLYFRDNEVYTFSHQFDRTSKRLEMPLAFTRFEDRALPGTGYTFEISTMPGAECAATVFDKSTETIMRNEWQNVSLYSPEAPDVYASNVCGKNETSRRVMFARATKSAARVGAAAPNQVYAAVDDAVAVESLEVMEDAAPMAANLETSEEEVTVRENFANTIAFEPFLRSDADGKISLSFTNSDKLSTYYVQLWAHDKDMHNAVLRKEMTVTIPVKVSIVEPQFLYTGDNYIAQASVSSNVQEAVKGRIKAEWYDGDELLGSSEKSVSLKAFGSEGYQFPIQVPDVKELDVKITFIAASKEHGSDAVKVKIPVSPAMQTITEAHSAILHSGESKEALTASLRAMFTNTSGDNAEMRDLSIVDMVREAIPSHVEPASKNVLDLTEALYVRRVAATLGATCQANETSDEKLISDILACRNEDGGFAWFAEMTSSPIITATLLSRFASLRKHGTIDDTLAKVINDETIADAVHYLDNCYFEEKSRPVWCGGISFDEYISTRSCFSEIPFKKAGLSKDRIASFKKEVKSYLVPKKERGLNGCVLDKARRMRVMYQLITGENGAGMAKDWGIKFFTRRRLSKSLQADFNSLLEYAIEHRSGGWYYPNAVMPYRGLLETEAYAHVFICDILEDCEEMYEYNGPAAQPQTIADGIRLWLMVQKETQKWDESPAFVDALSTILAGSDELLSTRVISLMKTVELPFSEVKKAENGMRVSRSFAVKKVDEDKEVYEALSEGDVLHVGDIVKAEYSIWNEENRSFVKLTAPRMASMRPIQQLSGRIGWWLRPLSVNGWYSLSPQGYRNVLRNGSEYWFDSYPEESTSISEEFYITQTGEFQMPAVEIECLYAPHYRGNDSGHPAINCIK